jgi:soluble lytic murein transglycosylase
MTLLPITLLILTLLCSPWLMAGTLKSAADDPLLLKQRKVFVAAEKALAKNDLSTYQQLREQLINYPLLVYLDYQETVKNLEQQSTQSIKNRLVHFEDTPLQRKLHKRWLKLLAKARLWPTYLEFSKQHEGSVTEQCRHVHAYIKTNQIEKAYAAIPRLWLSGKSQPKACDPVFNHWIASGHLTEKLLWQRFHLAMSQRQLSLARYLKRFFNKQEVIIADLWLTLYKHPQKVEKLLAHDHPMRDEMVTQILNRLAWRDVKTAFLAWDKFQTLDIFSEQQQQKAIYALAQGLAKDPNKKLNHRFNNILPDNFEFNSRLSEKILQAALQQNDWDKVLQLATPLSTREQNEEQWRYWQARALSQLGRKKQAHKVWLPLSQQRSYYGFLAAKRLGAKPKLEHVALQTEKGLAEKLALKPSLQRAQELYILNRLRSARQEWNHALKNATQEELRAAARLAQSWNWPSQSIITLAKLRAWNDLELRFPLAHRQAIDGHAKSHGIDSAWIYAILRQESAFISDARSSAGARGLMQLMPRTAKQIAQELQSNLLNLDDLFRPEINIKLGTGYLNKIYRDLQENPVLATAAYNAGPRRVKSWLPDQPQASDVWIETIPFHETREYLKRVLAYTVIYSYRLGDSNKIIPKKWLAPIESRQAFKGA